MAINNFYQIRLSRSSITPALFFLLKIIIIKQIYDFIVIDY